MLRVKRIAIKDLSTRSITLIKSLSMWKDELNQRVNSLSVAVLPEAEFDNNYVSFWTSFEGAAQESSLASLNEKQSYEFKRRSDELLAYLKGSQKLLNADLESTRALLAEFIQRAQHIFVFESIALLLLPYETKNEEQAYFATLPPVLPPPSHKGCLLPLLLGLLFFMLLLALFWYFFLRPWPMQGSLTDAWNRLFNQEVSAVVAKNEKAKKDPKAGEETLPAQKDDELLAKEENEAQEKANLKQERIEQERIEKEKLEKERIEKERLAQEKLEQEKKAQALKAQKEEARLKQEESLKVVPKCKVLKQQGNMPKMVIAVDGSQSMLLGDVPGSSSRLNAAVSSAKALADTIDKNVDIGFVEINGCPAAKSRGYFTGTQRQALKQTISGLNPMRYDGMTPLIDGLQQISRMTDGVNADAVGVLISDGEDTCPMTKNLDVCAVAKAIHKRQPRLKIHTILIGQDAGRAACVAKITGGKVFSPQTAGQIKADLQSSGSEMKKVCEE